MHNSILNIARRYLIKWLKIKIYIAKVIATLKFYLPLDIFLYPNLKLTLFMICVHVCQYIVSILNTFHKQFVNSFYSDPLLISPGIFLGPSGILLAAVVNSRVNFPPRPRMPPRPRFPKFPLLLRLLQLRIMFHRVQKL